MTSPSSPIAFVFPLLSSLVFLLACSPGPSSEPPESNSSKRLPNVIYILTDDLGYGDLSCYGQQTLSTPILDQMAREGMRFTQHYAGATVCSPSRASLMTGRHTGHTPIRGNKPDGQLLPREMTTLAEIFKAAGYRTGFLGKWGIGHPPPPDDPLHNGFEEAYGYINMWHAHNCYPEFLYENGEKVALPGNQLPAPNPWINMPEGTGVAAVKETFAPNVFRQRALDFIDEHQAEPFFLYLALNIPHANNEGKQDGMEVPDFGQYADRDWPDAEKGFAAMMDLIDQTTGDILNQLKTLGLDEHTLVIFTSDNGPHQEGGHKADYFDSNGPLRGKKRDLYEGGVRIPMIARWPETIPAGTESNHLSAFWDVLPTICELTEQPIPAGIDGISFLPTLLNQPNQQANHSYLYWEFYELGGRQGIREGNWKLVKLNVREGGDAPLTELYDLSKDLGETTNLADQYPEVVARLSKLMESAHQPIPLVSLFRE